MERLDPDRDRKLRYIKVRSIVNMLIKIVLVNEGIFGCFCSGRDFGVGWLVGWLERRWFEANGESVMIEGWKGGEGRGLIDDEPWIFGCARFCGIERREMKYLSRSG